MTEETLGFRHSVLTDSMVQDNVLGCDASGGVPPVLKLGRTYFSSLVIVASKMFKFGGYRSAQMWRNKG